MDLITFEEADFPIESYLIDFREKARKKIKNLDLEDKIKVLKQLSLLDLFLYRIKMDPGFYAHVSDEILESPKVLKLTYLYLLEKYYKVTNYGDDNIFKLSVSDQLKPDYIGESTTLDLLDMSRPRVPEEVLKQLSLTYTNPSKKAFENLKEEIEKQENKIDNPLDRIFYSLNITNLLSKNFIKFNDIKWKNRFLKEQMEKAQASNNIDRAYAIKSLIDEYATNKFQYSKIFDDNEIYIDTSLSYTDYWDHLSRKYLLENVRLFDIHQGTVDHFIYLNPITFGINIPLKVIISEYLHEFKELTKHPNEIVSKEDVHNVFIVSAIIWFINKEEKEKIALIDQFYTFNYTTFTKYKVNVTLVMGPEFSLEYAQALYDLGYFEQSRYIYNEFLKTYKSNDTGICTIKLRTMATYYQEDNTREVSKILMDVLKITMKHRGDTYFEMMKVPVFLDLFKQYKDSNPGESKHYMEEAIKQIQSLQPENRYNVLLYLAMAYDTIPDYNNSYRIYKELRDNINYVKEFKDYILDRVKLLEENRIDEQTIDKDKVSKIDEDTIYSLFSDKGSTLFYSLQFDQAGYLFNKAAKARDDSNIRGWFGILEYYKKDYGNAKSTFKSIIDEDTREISANLYLAIMSIIEGNEKDATGYLETSIDASFKTGVDYHLYKHLLPEDFIKLKENAYVSNIRMFIKEMLYHKKNTELYKLLESVEAVASQHVETSKYYMEIGLMFADSGFFKEASDYYFKALSKNPTEKVLSEILSKLGDNSSNQNDHKPAVDFYNQSLQHNPDDPYTLTNKAFSLMYLGDFKGAYDSIEKGLEQYKKKKSNYQSNKDAEEYYKRNLTILENVRDMVKAFKDHNIKIGFIDSTTKEGSTTIDILISADRLLFKMNDYGWANFDYSVALVEYGKALENLLHGNITKKVLEKINEKSKKEINDFLASDEYYEPPKYFERLIWYGNSLSLGDWVHIDELERNRNPLSKLFNSYLHDNYSIDEMNTIKTSCREISRYRNGSAHKDLKDKIKVLEVRSIIVNRLNDVIDIFHNKSKK